MSMYCAVHRAEIAPRVRAVLVGAVEQASGSGLAIYACKPCVDRHGIMPFEDRPVPSEWLPAYGSPPVGVTRAP